MYIGKRKVFIKNKVKFTLFILTVFLLGVIIFKFFFIDEVHGYENSKLNIITVRAGDTLWDIISQYGSEESDIREEIYHVKKVNNLNTAYLYPGQQLLVPIRD